MIPRGLTISTCSTVCFRYIKFVASALIYKEKRFINTALHYITQSVYIKSSSTADVIWTHRFNMATSYTTKQEIHVTSLDMSSAFDTISRSQLINSCEKFLEQDDVTLINTKMIIKIDNKFGYCFSTSIGSPQGDSSSPILFSIYLREALKNLPSHLSGKEIIYADDVNFVTEEEIDIEEICNTSKKYNLIVKKNKQK